MPAGAPDVIRPAFLWTPPVAVKSLGDEAAELAVQMDQEVREEERIALRALMPVKADGVTPAGLESGIISGRQQVKSWALEFALIHDGWVTKVGRCMWSAHQTKTSDDTFAHLTSLVESFDWLRKRVRRMYSGNGNHKIVFNDKLRTYPTLESAGRQLVDRTIEFGARETGKTGRGRTKINRLTFDEWLLGTEAMKGAQVPMMGTAGDRFIRYGSSPGLLVSESLRRLRDRGRIGCLDPKLGDPSLSWVEWTSERARLVTDPRTGRPRMERVIPECADPECQHIAGQVDGCYLDNLEGVIIPTNPAYGTGRLPADFVRDERRTLSVVEYARERAGHWEDPPTADGALDNGLPGYDLALTDRGASGPLTLGLEVSTDSRTASIGLHGGDVVEVIEYRKGAGLGWVPERVRELREAHGAPLAIRANSPAAQLLPNLPEDTVVVKSTEQAPACMSFSTDMNAAVLLHRAQPVLDIAVANAVKARTGDVWRWSMAKSAEERGADIGPLWAVVLARHIGAQSTYDPDDNFFP